MIKSLQGKTPDIEKAAFVAETAVLAGDVKLEEGSTIWYGAVLRGDRNSITVGKNSNVQDNSVVHVEADAPVVIGDNVTIGHSCIIHGCTIEDDCLIGMGSTIMNGAVIRKNSIVGAGALVTEGKEFPEGSLIIGSPAKVKSEITEEGRELIRFSSNAYIEDAEIYAPRVASRAHRETQASHAPRT